MSSRIHYSLALIPLFSFMAMSPMKLPTNTAFRMPASILSMETEGPTPKFEALAKKVSDPEWKYDSKVSKEVYLNSVKSFSKETVELKGKISKQSSIKSELQIQKDLVSDMVADISYQDIMVKGLIADNQLQGEEKEAQQKLISDSKAILEGLIGDLEVSEARIVEKDKPKVEVEVAKEEPKKEEVKVEVVKEEAKKEDSKVTSLEDKLCDMEEKNKALLTQITDLVADQRKIMDMMLQMQASMSQRGPSYTPYYGYTGLQQPIYMYQQVQPAASYGLQSYDFNPYLQPNLFSNPAPQQSMYQPIMGVNPQQYLEYDQRYSTSQILPGAFGNSNFLYDFQTPDRGLAINPTAMMF